MTPDDWNRADSLKLGLFSPINPFARGHAGLDDVLDVVESAGNELRPRTISFDKGKRKYSRQVLHERFAELQHALGGHTRLRLLCPQMSETVFHISGYKGDETSRFSFHLDLKPFSWCKETGRQEDRAAQLTRLVHALAVRLPLSYGYVHGETDYLLDKDLDDPGPRVPARVERMYWLNVYGPRIVQELGRERVLSTPAWRVEELPHGAVLVLTRPTPVDFASDEARLAQARALVHLHPSTSLDATLAQLHQRSLAFTPLDIQFHPDVKEILQQELDFQGLLLRRPLVERYNRYQPPPVSEWVSTSQQPWPDVPDPREVARRYEGEAVETLQLWMRKKVPSVMDLSPEALPRLDWHAWRQHPMEDGERERLTFLLGAFLGTLLVRRLQGRWVPRQDRDEGAVVVGDRAWRPFLRARHGLKDRQAALDFSLTQLFREAWRSSQGLTWS